MILVRHGQSEFNVHYGRTRRDPGIPDARLTEHGRRQARFAAERLAGEPLAAVVASPYTRALETAHVIADALGLPVHVERLVAERAAFTCDIGTSPAALAARWPGVAFDHLADPWWAALGESEEALAARCTAFRAAMAARADHHRVAVVSHWGFIRALTGLSVTNCSVVRYDPARPELPATLLGAPDEPFEPPPVVAAPDP
jgi:glucosyl-3-phosphoglycerate phosphatase